MRIFAPRSDGCAGIFPFYFASIRQKIRDLREWAMSFERFRTDILAEKRGTGDGTVERVDSTATMAPPVLF